MIVLGTYLIIFAFSITCSMYFADSIFVKYICEGSEDKISCNESLIVIDTALYGRNGSIKCPHEDNINHERTLLTCFNSSSLEAITQNCDNKNECYLRAKNEEFGDPCIGTTKYLHVEYTCKVACSNDTDIINASGILVDVSGFFYNDTLTYDCEPPTKRLTSGNLTRTCSENGTWSGEEPVCENVTCPEEQRTINSTGFLVYMTGNRYNDSLLYECDPKYYIPKGGNTTRVCNEKGIWSGSELNCQHCQCSSRKPLEPAEFEKMIEELKVEKKTTSKARRLKVSVKADRPSAKAVGCIGIVLLIVAGAIIIISDMPVLFRHIKRGLRNLVSAVYVY